MSLFKSVSRRKLGAFALAGLAAATLGVTHSKASTPEEIKARSKIKPAIWYNPSAVPI
jgi:hypothetical protein